MFVYMYACLYMCVCVCVCMQAYTHMHAGLMHTFDPTVTMGNNYLQDE